MQILKFGGTSVGSAERIQTVVEILLKKAGTHAVTGVFSAFSGVTDQLVAALDQAEKLGIHSPALGQMLRERHFQTLFALAEPAYRHDAEEVINIHLAELDRKLSGIALLRECSPRTRDAIISTGERLSLPVIAAALRSRGLKVREVDAAQLIRTGRQFTEAVVDFPATKQLALAQLSDLSHGEIAVVSGFIGGTFEGDVTTLGRGGSDYSAAILGSVLSAERVEIWTDVNGVLSADPRIIQDVVQLRDISYREAAEMAFFGAKVLHPKTMQPLETHDIPLVIRNTFQPSHPGTSIARTAGPSESPVTAISSIAEVSLISISAAGSGDLRISAAILNAVAGITRPLLLVSFGNADATVRLAVHNKDQHAIVTHIEKCLQDYIEQQLVQKINIEEGLSLLAIVGKPHQLQNGNLRRLFEIFSRHRIPTRTIASGNTDHSLSIIISRNDLDIAIKALHAAYFRTRPQRIIAAAAAAIGQG